MPAFADSWHYLCQTAEGTKFYIDEDSMLRDNMNAVVKLKLLDIIGTWRIEQARLNRSMRNIVVTSFVDYYPDGSIKGGGPVRQPEYVYIEPNVAAASVYLYLWPDAELVP
jgi:hypothetical protein